MAPKRKANEASNDAALDDSPTILYGKDAFWLQGLVGKSPNDLRNSFQPVPARDPTVAAYTNAELCDAASRVVYLLNHNLHQKNTYDICMWLGIDPLSPTGVVLVRDQRYEQSKWEKRILNFALKHVGNCIQNYQMENKGKKFHELIADERANYYGEIYHADPKSIATSMFKPVISVLDTSTVFNASTDSTLSQDDKDKMQAVRKMLGLKYIFACGWAYELLMQRITRVQWLWLACWRAYATYGPYRKDWSHSIVRVEDLPVSKAVFAGHPSEASARSAKRAKV
ncbi:hypothetical protein BDV96DRAFT_607983 [Lophiotrema nucula]|uniref:Uncharacterized protein n=1 Tax=Lophiotrema nucula TaxID=690887 RepID=A0A6A5YHG5_9PLEO|nr:hypothetical protein BDV96DRAFT_607983 [Lophiotrema nucula]